MIAEGEPRPDDGDTETPAQDPEKNLDTNLENIPETTEAEIRNEIQAFADGFVDMVEGDAISLDRHRAELIWSRRALSLLRLGQPEYEQKDYGSADPFSFMDERTVEELNKAMRAAARSLTRKFNSLFREDD